jgi:integrase
MATEKVRLTDARVRELILPEGKIQVDVWDDDLKGFGVRVGAKSKTFFVMGRVNGKLARPKIGRFPKIGTTAARSRAKIMLGEMEQGKNPSDAKRAIRAEQVSKKSAALDTSDTVYSMFEAMLTTKKELSPVTVSGYRYSFKRLATIQAAKVDKISREQVLTLHQQIERDNGPYAANRASCLLSGILNYSRAVIGRPANNPVTVLTDVGAWCEEKPKKVKLSSEQIKLFLQEVDNLGGYNASDLYRLLLYTGMRKSEGMGLRWEDVDFQSCTLHVPDTKNNTPLTLPMPLQVKTILSERRERWNQPNEGPVFPTHGKAGHSTQDYHFAAKVKKVIPGFSAHWLRKTFTTIAVAAGIDSMVIDRLTNHKPKGITAKHYYDPDVEDLREPMQRIADKIEEQAG